MMISSTHFHAIVVHFPVALLLVGFLSEVIALFNKKAFFRQSSFYLLFLGTIGCIVSYLSGNAAGEGIEEGTLRKALDLHEQAASISLWLSIAATIALGVYFFKYHRLWLKIVSIILLAGLTAAIARTGYLGGQLVYKHGAGVELALPDFSNADKK